MKQTEANGAERGPDAETGRASLIGTLLRAMRETSGQSVLFNQAVADQLGLNATDLRCLDIASRGAPLTAGQLAEATGLTTGAITGVVDRLERAGFARRERDPHDRRRVNVRPAPDSERAISPLFQPLAQAMAALCAGYSDDQIALILDFNRKTRQVLKNETARLRSSSS